MRNYVLVLGDQLDRSSAAFDGYDTARDAVWMAEVEEEATYLKQHKLRIAYFSAACGTSATTCGSEVWSFTTTSRPLTAPRTAGGPSAKCCGKTCGSTNRTG